TLIDGIGSRLWFSTNNGAPLYRVVSVDLASANPAWETVVPQTTETIGGASMVGDTVFVSYLKDASALVRRFSLAGEERGSVTLPGIGSVSGFTGQPGDGETFYSFASFDRPATIHRLDLHT